MVLGKPRALHPAEGTGFSPPGLTHKGNRGLQQTRVESALWEWEAGEAGRAGYEWGGRSRRKGDRRAEVRITVGLAQNETWEGPPDGQALHPRGGNMY